MIHYVILSILILIIFLSSHDAKAVTRYNKSVSVRFITQKIQGWGKNVVYVSSKLQTLVLIPSSLTINIEAIVTHKHTWMKQ